MIARPKITIAYLSGIFCQLAASAVAPAEAGEASAPSFRCSGTDAVIRLEAPANTDWICEGAAAAIDFLGAIGVPQRATVEINIVETLPSGLRDAVGCYDWLHGDIHVLGSDRCIRDTEAPQAFRVPNDAGIYRSYVAHEVAHALAAGSFGFAHPSAAAQEYIAGVVQLSVLEPGQRSEILSRFPGDGYDGAVEINFLNYQLDPGRFAVEAYRHFMKQKDGGAFVERLLSGDIRLKDQPTY